MKHKEDISVAALYVKLKLLDHLLPKQEIIANEWNSLQELQELLLMLSLAEECLLSLHAR